MCPDRTILSAWMDDEVEEPWARAIEEHLAACAGCRRSLATLEETRRLLREAPRVDWRAPMDRVRRRILAAAAKVPEDIPVWRRRISLPVPLAAAAMLLVVLLAGALVISVTGGAITLARTARLAASGSYLQIPVEDIEAVLRAMDGQGSFGDDVILLPTDVRLAPIGEPTIIKEADYSRRKP